MGDLFNYWFDNILAVCWRLIELPYFILIPACFALCLLPFILLKKFNERRGGLNRYGYYTAGFLITFIVAASFIADKKTAKVLEEVRFIRDQNIDRIRMLSEARQTTQGNAASAQGLRRNEYEVDLSSISGILKETYGENEITRSRPYESIDILHIIFAKPETRIYLAVVDIQYPGLQIRITPELREKYLISTFAKESKSQLAINGEAGNSPRQGSGFGSWIGNWISDGKPVLLMDGPQRPFLAFDKNNRAKYYKAAIVDTTNSSDKYNTIWGREDLLVKGEFIEPGKADKQPRTIMGINEDGSRLYLMIADGRQPGWSLGMELKMGAEILKAFGATDAMACDQGGSSCMYLEAWGGIITKPADGRERFTYSHFGISVPNAKDQPDEE